MTRLLLVLLAIALAGSIYLNLRQAGRISAQSSLLASRDKRIGELKEDLRKAAWKENSVLERQKEVVAGLQRQLADQKAVVDEADRRLQLAENNGLPQNDGPRIQARLDQERETLSELDQQLRGYKAQEAQLNGQAHDSMSQQDAGQRYDDQNLTAQIQSQTQRIQSTQARITALRGYIDLNSIDQRNQLQAELASEKAALNQLKAQRKQASAGWNESRNETRQAVERKRQQLQVAERQVTTQIATEKQTTQQLQQQLQSARKTVQSARDAIQSLQSQDQAERRKFRQLQAQLNDEQRKLDEMSR